MGETGGRLREKKWKSSPQNSLSESILRTMSLIGAPLGRATLYVRRPAHQCASRWSANQLLVVGMV